MIQSFPYTYSLEGEGVRLSHDEVDSHDWSPNDNTISLDEDTVTDVPVAWASTDTYCGSLAGAQSQPLHLS